MFLMLPSGVVSGNIHFDALLYDHSSSGMKKVSNACSPVIAVDRKATKSLHQQIYDACLGMISRIPVLTA